MNESSAARILLTFIAAVLMGERGHATAEETVRHIVVPTGVHAVKVVSQNWSHKEAEWFYNVSQGSRLLPYSFLIHLEQADSTQPFLAADYVSELGLIARTPDPQHNPGGLPIGLAKDENIDSVGLTCAACHTNVVHYAGTAYVIDGAPTLMDVERFLLALERALNATLNTPDKFDRFATAILPTPSVQQKQALRSKLEEILAERKGYNVRNLPASGRAPFGPGRVDAFGAILNEVTVRFLDVVGNHSPANAPVSYPYLWDTPQHDLVQWNGAAENSRNIFLAPVIGTSDAGALGRNAGEVLGVFGNVDVSQQLGLLHGYASSIHQKNLIEIEKSLRALWSPQWPNDFPAIAPSKAQQGKVLFERHCAECHAPIERDAEDRTVEAKMRAVGTDQTMARNFATRVSSTGPLRGRTHSILGFSRFGVQAPAAEILTHVVQRMLVGPNGGDTEINAAPESVTPSGGSDPNDRATLLAKAADNIQYRVHVEVSVGDTSLSGAFSSVKTRDSKVIGLSGGRRIAIERRGARSAVDVSHERGVTTTAESNEALRMINDAIPLSAADDGVTLSELNDAQIRYQYKGRPLNGIWATAPYLHNGSVPTLRELLKPPGERVTKFHVGSRDFLPNDIGYRYDSGPFELDTTLPGNSNAGHTYGSNLSPDDRELLLEYLKSL